MSASPLSAEDQSVLIFNYGPTYLLSRHFNKTPPVLNAGGGMSHTNVAAIPRNAEM